jgi:hypothetical protein
MNLRYFIFYFLSFFGRSSYVIRYVVFVYYCIFIIGHQAVHSKCKHSTELEQFF